MSRTEAFGQGTGGAGSTPTQFNLPGPMGDYPHRMQTPSHPSGIGWDRDPQAPCECCGATKTHPIHSQGARDAHMAHLHAQAEAARAAQPPPPKKTRLNPASLPEGHKAKDPAYRKGYTQGWNYSARSSSPSLEHLDVSGASKATYDGYYDHSAGREKWHLANPHDHDKCPDA